MRIGPKISQTDERGTQVGVNRNNPPPASIAEPKMEATESP